MRKKNLKYCSIILVLVLIGGYIWAVQTKMKGNPLDIEREGISSVVYRSTQYEVLHPLEEIELPEEMWDTVVEKLNGMRTLDKINSENTYAGMEHWFDISYEDGRKIHLDFAADDNFSVVNIAIDGQLGAQYYCTGKTKSSDFLYLKDFVEQWRDMNPKTE